MISNPPKLTRSTLDIDKNEDVLIKSDIVLSTDVVVCEFHMNEDSFKELATFLKTQIKTRKDDTNYQRALKKEQEELKKFYTLSIRNKINNIQNQINALQTELSNMDIPYKPNDDDFKIMDFNINFMGFTTSKKLKKIKDDIGVLLDLKEFRVFDKKLHDAPGNILRKNNVNGIIKLENAQSLKFVGEIHKKGIGDGKNIKGATILDIDAIRKEYTVRYYVDTRGLQIEHHVIIKQANMCVSTPTTNELNKKV